MGLLNDLIDTATKAGKQALEDQVRQQTRDAINSVSNKVGSTVRDKINGDGAAQQQAPTTPADAQAIAQPANPAPAAAQTATATAETQAAPVATPPADPQTAAPQAPEPELRAPVGENSIAEDVGNIFEKVGLGSKSELGEAVKDFEQSTVSDINNAMKVLNKATGSNESTTATNLKEAADNFIGATAKYSDNPVDQAETRAATSAAQSEIDNYKNL